MWLFRWWLTHTTLLPYESLRADMTTTKGDKSKCSSDGRVLCCLTSCESYPRTTWELESQRIGCLTALWAAGETITGIYTVNDGENENVTYSGMLVALTMNTNETWSSLEENGMGAEGEDCCCVAREWNKGWLMQRSDRLGYETTGRTECTIDDRKLTGKNILNVLTVAALINVINCLVYKEQFEEVILGSGNIIQSKTLKKM